LTPRQAGRLTVGRNVTLTLTCRLSYPVTETRRRASNTLPLLTSWRPSGVPECLQSKRTLKVTSELNLIKYHLMKFWQKFPSTKTLFTTASYRLGWFLKRSRKMCPLPSSHTRGHLLISETLRAFSWHLMLRFNTIFPYIQILVINGQNKGHFISARIRDSVTNTNGLWMDDWIYWHFLKITLNYNSSLAPFLTELRVSSLPTVTDLVRIYVSVTSSASVVRWLPLHSWTLNSLRNESEWMESELYVTTDGQPASLSWNKAPIWGLRPDLCYLCDS
jgi:hypothetical protein